MSRPANASSQLLTPAENQQLFELLGPRRFSMATAVVQLVTTQPPSHARWQLQHTGALCLTRDNQRRSYYLQLYGVDTLLWEHELYQDFALHPSSSSASSPPLERFATFEADTCQAGLSFADAAEARHFCRRVSEHVQHKRTGREQRRRNKQQTRPPPISSTATATPAALPSTATANGASLIDRYKSSGKSMKKSFKLTKADISMPTNFQHLSHVGWDPDRGFDLENVDPNLKKFFNHAGVSDSQLQDQDTRNFIYDFIREHGGVEAAIQEVREPMTSRSGAAPAPPNRSRSTRNRAPAGGTLPPPPPPPPPMVAAVATAAPATAHPPPAQSGRDALLASIRQGTQLRTVNQSEESGSASSTLQRSSNAGEGDTSGMAAALSRALADRHLAMHSSGDSELSDQDEWE